MEELGKRLVEVEYVLKMLDDEHLTKIPSEVWNYLADNKDRDYVFIYDNNKTLDEQNLSIDTISILTYINMKYLLEEKEKKELLELLKKDEIIAEEEKNKLYNPDDLFRNKKIKPKEELALVEVKIEKWYEKLFSFLKKLVKK